MPLSSLTRRAARRAVPLAAALTAGAAVVSLSAGPTAAAPGDGARGGRDDAPLVVAHRGSSGTAPENTLAAAREAISDRADEIENDIQRSRDGVLVLFHDTTLLRTTDVEEVFPGRPSYGVGDFTLRELKRLDAGSWFGPEFAGERIPTLVEWGRTVSTRSRMLLEMKSPSTFPGIADDLDRVLRTEPAFRTALRRDRLVVQSFEIEWLRAYEDRSPAVPKGLLYGTRPTQAQIDAAAGWAEWVNPSFRVITEADVDAIQAAGLRTGVYTVNTGQDLRRMVRWGVDAIITDYPQVLRGILRRG